jgi:cyclopropane-fatty-acyl-phospholipid synthase
MNAIRLFENGLMPDILIRPALRRKVRGDLRRFYRVPVEKQRSYYNAFLWKMRRSPIAIHTDRANEQHYELPPRFFELVLGSRLKYSACYWPDKSTTLDEAEVCMLKLTCERAQLEDGMRVLDLGCGWGSLSLYIAEHYPNCRITALSNSALQCTYIEQAAKSSGFSHLETKTADIGTLDLPIRFDRVFSIEMFEHMKNYGVLMAKIAGMIREKGRLFVHIFSHREFPYEYVVRGSDDWMAKYFFTGGNMPSADLLLNFQRDLKIISHWRIDGTHYARTLRAWLHNLDRNRAPVRDTVSHVYGEDQAMLWFRRWRLFFIFCEENFNLSHGREYLVSHYLFEK